MPDAFFLWFSSYCNVVTGHHICTFCQILKNKFGQNFHIILIKNFLYFFCKWYTATASIKLQDILSNSSPDLKFVGTAHYCILAMGETKVFFLTRQKLKYSNFIELYQIFIALFLSYLY